MLPIFELGGPHIEVAGCDVAQQDILRSNAEIAHRVTHRRRAIATTAGLMEQQRPVHCPQLLDDPCGIVGDQDTINHRPPFLLNGMMNRGHVMVIVASRSLAIQRARTLGRA
jgi:hypothetical protein